MQLKYQYRVSPPRVLITSLQRFCFNAGN